jgi:hypothetical protein
MCAVIPIKKVLRDAVGGVQLVFAPSHLAQILNAHSLSIPGIQGNEGLVGVRSVAQTDGPGPHFRGGSGRWRSLIAGCTGWSADLTPAS